VQAVLDLFNVEGSYLRERLTQRAAVYERVRGAAARCWSTSTAPVGLLNERQAARMAAQCHSVWVVRRGPLTGGCQERRVAERVLRMSCSSH